MLKSSISACGEIVRAHDPDRFLLSMFAPAAARSDLWALFAFNHEIAKTREVVSDSTLGLIRLQWWRDAINGIYEGKILAHEVVAPLAQAIERHNLPRDLFDTLLYAREFDLEDVLPGNVEGLINYADFTTTPLLKLAVRITGGDEAAEVVQPIAINYAIIGILRAIHFHGRAGRCYLPEDLMMQHSIKRVEIGNPKNRQALSQIAVKVAEKSFVHGVKVDSQILQAHNNFARIYFDHLKRAKFDTMSHKYMNPPAFLTLRLAVQNLFM